MPPGENNNEETRHLSIYAGRTLLGCVQGVDGASRCAFDAAGNPLPGEFCNYLAAASAVNVACASPSVADDRFDGTA